MVLLTPSPIFFLLSSSSSSHCRWDWPAIHQGRNKWSQREAVTFANTSKLIIVRHETFDTVSSILLTKDKMKDCFFYIVDLCICRTEISQQVFLKNNRVDCFQNNIRPYRSKKEWTKAFCLVQLSFFCISSGTNGTSRERSLGAAFSPTRSRSKNCTVMDLLVQRSSSSGY